MFIVTQVVNSRRESDAGVYWCEAKNEFGIFRSRNATLQVAGEPYCNCLFIFKRKKNTVFFFFCFSFFIFR